MLRCAAPGIPFWDLGRIYREKRYSNAFLNKCAGKCTLCQSAMCFVQDFKERLYWRVRNDVHCSLFRILMWLTSRFFYQVPSSCNRSFIVFDQCFEASSIRSTSFVV